MAQSRQNSFQSTVHHVWFFQVQEPPQKSTSYSLFTRETNCGSNLAVGACAQQSCTLMFPREGIPLSLLLSLFLAFQVQASHSLQTPTGSRHQLIQCRAILGVSFPQTPSFRVTYSCWQSTLTLSLGLSSHSDMLFLAADHSIPMLQLSCESLCALQCP